MDFSYYLIKEKNKFFRFDYEVFNEDQQLLLYGRGKNFGTKTSFKNPKEEKIFTIRAKGLFKRTYDVIRDNQVATTLRTDKIILRKEFSFEYAGRAILVTSKGYWKDTTFFDGAKEIAKVSRTKKSMFANDEYALAMSTDYDPIIFIGIVVCLNKIKTAAEHSG